jgi:hypothetical protein
MRESVLTTSVTWDRYSLVWADLSEAERLALRAIWGEVNEAVAPSVLTSLHELALIKFDGNRWVLTDEGSVVAPLCCQRDKFSLIANHA